MEIPAEIMVDVYVLWAKVSVDWDIFENPFSTHIPLEKMVILWGHGHELGSS